MKLSPEAKVGLLVFAGILLLTYMSFRVGEFRVTGKGWTTVHFLFDSAAGLSKDASVQIAGVEVGKVYNIQLRDGKADVSVRLYPEVSIDRAARPYIRSVGLLGDKHVEIVLGDSRESLGEDEAIVAPPGTEDIGQLVGKLSSVADDMKAVSASLKGALGGAEGEESIRDILQNFRDLSANLSQVVDRNDDRFERILANMDELTEGLNETVRASKEDFRTTMSHTRSASESIDSIMRKVDEGRGTIGRLVNEEDLSKNLNDVLVSAEDVFGVKKKYRALVGLRTEDLVEANDTKGYVSLTLQPRKDKFYLFEAVSPEGTKGDFSETKTTRRITNAGSGAGSDFFPVDVTQTIEQTKSSDDLMWTAMFGRTFGETSFRIGLQESTGGIGIDHNLLGTRAALHFDVWDFEGENSFGGSAHAKVRADLNFLKFFSVHAGFDNFLNEEDSSLFFGAGMSFEDDDLKDFLSFTSIGK